MKIYNNKIPRWLKKLSYDSNKELLLQLHSASANGISQPREVIFTIKNVKGKDSLENICHYGEQHGWVPEIQYDYADKNIYWVEFKKHNYSIDEVNIFKDEEFFQRIAKMYGVTYDGWYASAS